jgi:hypothetical protein
MRKLTAEVSLPIPLTATEVGEASRGPAPSQRYREQQIRPHVQYLGCRVTDDGREYSLQAPSRSSSVFVLFIAHGHFTSGGVRFQDGPDLCCAKLTRVLTEDAGASTVDTRFEVTAEELLEYRISRIAPSERKRRRRRADAE